MQTNVLWKGREYDSMENCLIKLTERGYTITSTIIGHYEGKIYHVDYRIDTNLLWETLFCELTSRHSDQTQLIRLASDGIGNWTSNGQQLGQFKGCIDIDIPLTPFTNSLPINRLNLARNEAREIQVIYLDLLEGHTHRVNQKYTRMSEFDYHYENVPNDFEAVITVDESGLVVEYPLLFSRLAALKTN